jgi:concentrative nucleoside transporter, CNT family
MAARAEAGVAFVAQTGAFFAFNVLPTIIFFSALMSVLYYLGVMQLIVQALAWVMQKTLGPRRRDAVGVGQHLPRADRVAAADQAVRGHDDTLGAQHGDGGRLRDRGRRRARGVRRHALRVVSRHREPPAGRERDERAGRPRALQDPAARNETPVTRAGIGAAAEAAPKPGRWRFLRVGADTTDNSVIEAAANGAGQGVQLAINVGAMLMAFVALVAMLNACSAGPARSWGSTG